MRVKKALFYEHSHSIFITLGADHILITEICESWKNTKRGI